MRFQDTVLGGLLKLVPHGQFTRLAVRHGSDKGIRRLSSWLQLVALVVTQLAGCRSLRELEALYRAESGESGAAPPELPLQYADFALWQREWLDAVRLGPPSGRHAPVHLPRGEGRPRVHEDERVAAAARQTLHALPATRTERGTSCQEERHVHAKLHRDFHQTLPGPAESP